MAGKGHQSRKQQVPEQQSSKPQSTSEPLSNSHILSRDPPLGWVACTQGGAALIPEARINPSIAFFIPEAHTLDAASSKSPTDGHMWL